MSDDTKNQYKHTLNLPKTSFAMKANLAQREPQRLKSWTKADVYGQIRAKFAGRETFILHDGLPTLMVIFILAIRLIRSLKILLLSQKRCRALMRPICLTRLPLALYPGIKVETKIGKAGVKVDHPNFPTQMS